MGTFVAAYTIVWLALVVYVGRLGVRQRRLWQQLKSIQAEVDRTK